MLENTEPLRAVRVYPPGRDIPIPAIMLRYVIMKRREDLGRMILSGKEIKHQYGADF